MSMALQGSVGVNAQQLQSMCAIDHVEKTQPATRLELFAYHSANPLP